jgi:hypothetical protein
MRMAENAFILFIGIIIILGRLYKIKDKNYFFFAILENNLGVFVSWESAQINVY